MVKAVDMMSTCNHRVDNMGIAGEFTEPYVWCNVLGMEKIRPMLMRATWSLTFYSGDIP